MYIMVTKITEFYNKYSFIYFHNGALKKNDLIDLISYC